MSVPPVKQIPYVLFGLGGVGRALLKAILAAAPAHRDSYGVEFVAVALCDSSGAVGVKGAPLSHEEVRAVLAAKESGEKLSSLGDRYVPRGDAVSGADFLVSVVGEAEKWAAIAKVVVVDCTATADTVPALLAAVRKQLKVCAANKKPFTVEQAVYDELTSDANTGFKRLGACRFESAVGAGLPVIAALTRTVAAQDPISKILGTFSGTLGFVMTGLQAGRPFSEVVAEAKELGYTEPDPRDDLGGVDVARKALILARGMGWKLELQDVEVEPLFPAELGDSGAVSVADFMAALPGLDQGYAEKVEAAKAQGQVLRYSASVDGATRKLVVAPALVSSDTPLGRLQGTDNLVEIYTEWYQQPLVIQGAGAGVGATAAGVLADMIELAFTA